MSRWMDPQPSDPADPLYFEGPDDLPETVVIDGVAKEVTSFGNHSSLSSASPPCAHTTIDNIFIDRLLCRSRKTDFEGVEVVPPKCHHGPQTLKNGTEARENRPCRPLDRITPGRPVIIPVHNFKSRPRRRSSIFQRLPKVSASSRGLLAIPRLSAPPSGGFSAPATKTTPTTMLKLLAWQIQNIGGPSRIIVVLQEQRSIRPARVVFLGEVHD